MSNDEHEEGIELPAPTLFPLIVAFGLTLGFAGLVTHPFVTITGVDTSPDLRAARVYYSVLGDEEQRKATAGALGRAKPRIRSVVGSQVRLKYLPDLHFEYDDAMDRGLRIDQLLRDVSEEADQ